MGQRLINALREITPVVIDFEYTTPTGAAPEPIEIVVQALRVRDETLERTAPRPGCCSTTASTAPTSPGLTCSTPCQWEALMRRPSTPS